MVEQLVSRRSVLGGAGVAVACTLVPIRARTAPDPFHDIHARAGAAKLRGGDAGPTPIRGYEGAVPGPMLRVRRGEELRVRLINELVADTTIHWHGVRVPNAMDGVAGLTQAAVSPGESFEYRFAPPDAGTFWYHSPSPFLEDRALYGLLIVDETPAVDVDRDVALILDAWTLGADGRADADGKTSFTVNGVPSLDIPIATNERLRLRLLNASRERLLAARLDRHTATVVAIDGQPSEPFAARDGRVVLSPGNRIDLMIDAKLEPGSIAPIFLGLDEREVPLARLVYRSDGGRSAPREGVKPLPDNPLPQRMNLASAIRLDIALDDPRYRTKDFGRPLFRAAPRQTVVMGFKNPTAEAHVVHLHGHCARQLDALDDGWKPYLARHDPRPTAADDANRIRCRKPR